LSFCIHSPIEIYDTSEEIIIGPKNNITDLKEAVEIWGYKYCY